MKYIFIHGLGQNPSSWDKTKTFISEPINADVLCPNLSLILDNKEVTYLNLYNAFSDYCKNINEPLNLCGLSLGGILALNYTIDYPTKVKSLVLIAAQYKIPKTLIKLQNIIFRFMPETTFKDMGFQKNEFIQLTNSMIDLDFSTQLRSILCKTLIVCGDKDRANKKASKYLADNIYNSKFKLIENANHEVNSDNPKKLAYELEIFYQK